MTKGNLFMLALIIVVVGFCACVPTTDQESTDGRGALTQSGPDSSKSDGMAGDGIFNGGFEEGRVGWSVTSSGTGATWREHELIGFEPDFEPRSGIGAARLGGHEGSYDRLEQTVTVPPGGLLTYWWQIRQPRPVSRLTVSLARPDGSQAVVLAVHRDGEAEAGWQQDSIDVSQYSGQELILRILVDNDNYTMTAFDIDDVELSGVGEP